MRAEVFKGRHLALRAAVENDFLTTDLPAQRLVLDFIGHAGDVPGVFREHDESLLRVFVFIGLIVIYHNYIGQPKPG
ncbi:hypothetical protein D3C86_1947340 [compost metagenome]